jgi:hypothetical protein
MTTPADILEALGQPDNAATLRWAETPVPAAELTEQLADVTEQLAEAQVLLGQLEALPCKPCAKKWKTL